MSFVHVEGRGLEAERAQQPHAADAEHNLLHDARGTVPAIDAQREIAVVRLVFPPVGVEQIDRHPANVHAPGVEKYRAGDDAHGADHLLAAGVEHRFEREVSRIEQGVVLGLPVLLVEGLLKISFAIKQADADETEAQIAR